VAAKKFGNHDRSLSLDAISSSCLLGLLIEQMNPITLKKKLPAMVVQQ